jgi:predicted nucleic acid-binding protein
MRTHLDTDFLVHAVSSAGPERRALLALADSEDEVEISAVAWYEFARGPRTPEQLAVARAFFGEHGVVPLSEDIALDAAEIFRRLGSPRKRAADIAIAATAIACRASLWTHNARDFAGIAGLELRRP